MKSVMPFAFAAFLAAAMAVCSPVLQAQEPAAADETSTPEKFKFDPEEVLLVAHIRTDRLFSTKYMEGQPVEVVTAIGKKYGGVDPMQFTSITFVQTFPVEQFESPKLLAIVKTSEALNEETFFAGIDEIVEHAIPKEEVAKAVPQLRGRAFFDNRLPIPAFAAHLIDEHTFLIGDERFVLPVVQEDAIDELTSFIKPLMATSEHVDLSAVAKLVPIRKKIEKFGFPFPKRFEQVPNDAESVTVQLSFVDRMQANVQIEAVDAAAAKRLETLLTSLMDEGKQSLLDQAQEMQASENKLEAAMGKYQQRIATAMFQKLAPTQEGNTIGLTFPPDGDDGSELNTVLAGALTSILLPVINEARIAARSAQSTNNLKQLTIAMHNFYATSGALPAQASTDEDGQKLLSWRVHLLPFLFEADLYEQFHLDEPWDSDHNMKLISQMPDVFRDPNSQAPEFHTTYLVPVGQNMAFEPPTKQTKEVVPLGLKFQAFTDGISDTIMLVNADDEAAVPWTKPDDLEVDLQNVWNHLNGFRYDGLQVGIGDGSVQTLPPKTTATALQRLFQRNDQQAGPAN